MKNNKKVTAIVASVLGVSAVVITAATMITGTNAYFKDSEKNKTKGVAGEVTIAEEQIDINNASSYIVGNGVDINMGRYMTTGSAIEGSDGWVAENATQVSVYSPVWQASKHKTDNGYIVKNSDGTYSCELCEEESISSANIIKEYLYPNFFRTSEGKVAYCMDNGKTEPSDGICNMNTPVSDAAKRIILNGYPQKNGSTYGITDAELEWCTQIALYIAEGTGYEEDGTSMAENIFNITDFNTYYGYDSANETSAKKLYEVIETLVSKSQDKNIVASVYKLNTNKTDIVKDTSGFLAGPYSISTDLTGDIDLTSSDSSVLFKNTNKENITKITANSDFYVYIPNEVTSEITINASINGATIIPSYYYWSGRTEEQKMVVASFVPATLTIHISTTNELMPGETVDIGVLIENTGNKAIVTRNNIYLYWEYDDETEKSLSNGDKSIFLYNQNVPKSQIMEELLLKTNPSAEPASTSGPTPTNEPTDSSTGEPASTSGPTGGLFDMGVLQEMQIKGETVTGYKFTVYGDSLDGVGNSAETGFSSEVNYSSYLDDASTYKDYLTFKLALSPYANIHTSGQKLKMIVVTEAMQYQNTDDSNWTEVGYAESVVNY